MKVVIKLLAAFLTCGTIHAASSQVVPLRTPPLPPGQTVKTSLTNAQAAIRAIVEPGVTRSIQIGGNDAEGIAYYFRSIRGVFCAMATNANFSAEHLIAEVDKLPSPLAPDTYFLDVKASIVTAYKLAYADRNRADVSPLEWLSKISETFCSSIWDGIQKGGKGNVL